MRARWGEGGAFNAGEAIQIAYQLLEIRTLWAFEAGARIVAAAAAREPGCIRLAYMRIRFAIALSRDAEALALIDALPKRFVRPEFLELRRRSRADPPFDPPLPGQPVVAGRRRDGLCRVSQRGGADIPALPEARQGDRAAAARGCHRGALAEARRDRASAATPPSRSSTGRGRGNSLAA